MAELITITTDDLLRLGYSEGQIRHIFDELINKPLLERETFAAPVVSVDKENRQIQIKDLSEKVFKEAVETIYPETFTVTTDIGNYRRGDTIAADKSVRDVLKELLFKKINATIADITNPSIKIAESANPNIYVSGNQAGATFVATNKYRLTNRYIEYGNKIVAIDNIKIDFNTGNYTWGPDPTGVGFETLRVDISSNIGDDVINSAYLNADFIVSKDNKTSSTTIPAVDNSDSFNNKFKVLPGGLNKLKFQAYSKVSDGNIAYNNDNTLAIDPTNPEDTGIKYNAPTSDFYHEIYNISDITEFTISGYYNEVYILTNPEGLSGTNPSGDLFRSSGTHYRLKPASLTVNELKEVYIAVRSDLRCRKIEVTNIKENMPQNVSKLDSNITIPAGSFADPQSYTVFKIYNLIAADGEDEYSIKYITD